MAVDWLAIRNDYINGGGSYRKLAEKYGVSFNTLKDKAVAEGWKKIKDDHHNKTAMETQQKSQEKIAEALSNEAAAKARIRLKMIEMAENWVISQSGVVSDPADYRRMVQSCMDMGVFDEGIAHAGETREDDPLTKALKEEAERMNNENS